MKSSAGKKQSICDGETDNDLLEVVACGPHTIDGVDKLGDTKSTSHTNAGADERRKAVKSGKLDPPALAALRAYMDRKRAEVQLRVSEQKAAEAAKLQHKMRVLQEEMARSRRAAHKQMQSKHSHSHSHRTSRPRPAWIDLYAEPHSDVDLGLGYGSGASASANARGFTRPVWADQASGFELQPSDDWSSPRDALASARMMFRQALGGTASGSGIGARSAQRPSRSFSPAASQQRPIRPRTAGPVSTVGIPSKYSSLPRSNTNR
jgi:hypothetical protein